MWLDNPTISTVLMDCICWRAGHRRCTSLHNPAFRVENLCNKWPCEPMSYTLKHHSMIWAWILQTNITFGLTTQLHHKDSLQQKVYCLSDPDADHTSHAIEMDRLGDMDAAIAAFRAAAFFTGHRYKHTRTGQKSSPYFIVWFHPGRSLGTTSALHWMIPQILEPGM